jgi:tripartite-type tricarboxylate transporter receptor subunit TctC
MVGLSRRSLLAALAVSAAAPSLTKAQGLSDRNIFIIVPFTPGSGPDVLARIVGEELRKRWNQPVIIDNKPGASGNIGAAAAARAEPDGHTILLSVNTFLMNAALSKSLSYDPVKSFAPIVELATGSLVLAVHPSIPVKSTRELIDYATGAGRPSISRWSCSSSRPAWISGTFPTQALPAP